MGRLEEQLGAIIDAVDFDAWRRVPTMVVALYKKAAPAACRLAAWADSAAGPEDRLWWHPDTKTVWAEIFDIEKRADWERLPDVPDVPGAALFIEPIPPPPVAGWVLVKAANGYLEPIARPSRVMQTAIGGPNGLTAALVNGLIGGGLGYGAGWLADQFLPEEHFQKGSLPLTLGLTGAGIGGGVGLWQHSAEQRAKSLPPGSTGVPYYPLPPHVPVWGRDKHSPLKGLPGMPPKIGSVNPRLYKAAQEFGNTGAMFTPNIPVDAFNRTIWNDVRYPPSAFGARSPWGDNGQPMGTPPYAAAATSGLLAGASQAAQSHYVSPWQVGTAAAIGAGKGWVTGLAAGKVLGALAGLRPESQQKLQDVGLWGGLITGVANSLFR